MQSAAWFTLAGLVGLALFATSAYFRRRHEVRKITRQGVTYSERLDGRFVGPDGRIVSDPVLVAALASSAAYLAARGPNSDRSADGSFSGGGADSGLAAGGPCDSGGGHIGGDSC